MISPSGIVLEALFNDLFDNYGVPETAKEIPQVLLLPLIVGTVDNTRENFCV